MFPLGSINRDESMYVFAARLLRTGHLTLPETYLPFRPWASGLHGDHLVLKYAPVWPSVLAIGDLLGSMRIGVAVTSAAAVALMGLLGRELFGRWKEGLLAAAVLLLSPLFFVQGGTYLSYLFQLTLDVAILLLVVGAARRESGSGPLPRRVRGRLVAAGALWGVAFWAREYDAVLLAAPLVVVGVVAGRRAPRRIGAWAGWCSAGAALPLAALLVQNRILLGSPLTNTFTITGRYDTLGFGRRGVFPTSSFEFRPHDALISVTRNIARLPSWTFGGFILVALAAFGLWRNRRRGPTIWAIAGVGVAVVAGYAVFWSPYAIVELWPGTRTLGPFYHLALLIPLVLFGAAGLAALSEHSRTGTGAIALVMIAATALGVVTKVQRNLPITRQYRSAQRLVDDAHLVDAVLFMEDRGQNGFQSAAPFLENHPDLDQPVIYAVEGGPDDFEVLARYPKRTPYRLRAELRPGDELLDPTRFIERLRLRRAPTQHIRVRIVNTTGAPTVATRARVGDQERTVVLDRTSRKGSTYDVVWTLTTDPTREDASETTITVPPSTGDAEIEAGFTDSDATTDRYQLVYPYSVSDGRVNLLTPGRGRFLFEYGDPVWLNQDVSTTLAERG
jgi:hypothetical protein